MTTGLARLVAVVSFVCCSVASAQGVVLRAQAGFDGVARVGAYMPVAVDLENRGANVRGILEASCGDEQPNLYRRRIELPAGAKKRVYLYVAPEAWVGQLKLTFRPDRGRPLIAPKRLDMQDPTRTLVAVVGPPEVSYAFLRDIETLPRARTAGALTYPLTSSQGPIALGHLEPQNAPGQWKGYDAADLLIVDSAALDQLDDRQAEAIRRWTGAGGNLVVIGGENWRAIAQSSIAEMLPIRPTGSVVLPNLRALHHAHGGDLENLPAPVAIGPLVVGEVVLTQDGVPLIARRPYGVGNVWFLAFAVSERPFRGWSAAKEPFADILRDSRIALQPLTSRVNDESICEAMRDRQAIRLPSFKLVSLFLLCYVLCLVPGNYFVLKRLKRRELAWVTVPAIVVVFSLAAYGIGLAQKGRSVLLYSVSVLETRAGASVASASTYFDIFSPAKMRYRITFSDPEVAVISPGGNEYGYSYSHQPRDEPPLRISQDEQEAIEDLEINMWSHRFLGARSAHVLQGRFDAALALKNNEVTGTLVNKTGMTLEDAVVYCLCSVGRTRRSSNGAVSQVAYYGSATTRLGDLGPGESTRVSLSVSSRGSPEFAELLGHSTGVPLRSIRGSELYRSEASEAVNEVLRAASLTDAKGEFDRSWVLRAVLEGGSDMSWPVNEALLIAWADDAPLAVRLDKQKAKRANVTLVLVHLPIAGVGLAGE